MREITVSINGNESSLAVDERLLLSDFLRGTLGLTGTHVGCEHGYCGACTVLVDGESVRACLALAVQVDGTCVQTVEGLASEDGSLNPIQAAFKQCHGLQCGFCTSGLLMSVTELLSSAPPTLSRDQIRHELAGNVCRCTGYHQIIDAVEMAFNSSESETVVRAASD